MYEPAEVITIANYDNLKDKMSNMDLIMFRKDDIVSDLILDLTNENIITKSNSADLNKQNITFTHVGLIIKSDLLPGYSLDPNKIYILESTYSYGITGMDNGPPDCLNNEQFFGVQLRDLETICKRYILNEKTKMVLVKLKTSPNIKDFTSIFKKYYWRPFLREEISLMFPNINFKQITSETLISFKSYMNKMWMPFILQYTFSCVDLVTSIYSDLGIICLTNKITYPMELLTLKSVAKIPVQPLNNGKSLHRRVIYMEDI